MSVERHSTPGRGCEMLCDQTMVGPRSSRLAAKPMLFGPGLDDVSGVTRVEVWFTEDHEGVDFTEFQGFVGNQRWKTIGRQDIKSTILGTRDENLNWTRQGMMVVHAMYFLSTRNV